MYFRGVESSTNDENFSDSFYAIELISDYLIRKDIKTMKNELKITYRKVGSRG